LKRRSNRNKRDKRSDRHIRRLALQNPKVSTIVKVYGSGDDQSLITLTGFDHKVFAICLINLSWFIILILYPYLERKNK
jgi:hypothetical protein